jgi:hypothetical protein
MTNEPTIDEVRLFLWDHLPHSGGIGIGQSDDDPTNIELVCACGEWMPLGKDPVSTGERLKGGGLP